MPELTQAFREAFLSVNARTLLANHHKGEKRDPTREGNYEWGESYADLWVASRSIRLKSVFIRD